MLNRCEFIGNLGRDPETRSTQGGAKVVNLNLAVSEKWTDKNGERKEKTEWVRITIWNEKLADVAEKYLTKGSRVYVSGQLETRKWTDQSGAERYLTEIVLSRFKGELVLLGGGEREGQRQERPSGGGGSGRPPAGTRGPHDDLDDEIPFAPCWW